MTVENVFVDGSAIDTVYVDGVKVFGEKKVTNTYYEDEYGIIGKLYTRVYFEIDIAEEGSDSYGNWVIPKLCIQEEGDDDGHHHYPKLLLEFMFMDKNGNQKYYRVQKTASANSSGNFTTYRTAKSYDGNIDCTTFAIKSDHDCSYTGVSSYPMSSDDNHIVVSNVYCYNRKWHQCIFDETVDVPYKEEYGYTSVPHTETNTEYIRRLYAY